MTTLLNCEKEAKFDAHFTPVIFNVLLGKAPQDKCFNGITLLIYILREKFRDTFQKTQNTALNAYIFMSNRYYYAIIKLLASIMP